MNKYSCSETVSLASIPCNEVSCNVDNTINKLVGLYMQLDLTKKQAALVKKMQKKYPTSMVVIIPTDKEL